MVFDIICSFSERVPDSAMHCISLQYFTIALPASLILSRSFRLTAFIANMSPKLLSLTSVASLIVSATCQLGTSGPLPEMVRNASCQGGTVVTPNFGVGSYNCVKAQYGHLHGNITAFWYEYWKPLYYAQAYPFTGYADIDDFEPVFETLIKVCIKLESQQKHSSSYTL